MKHDQWDRDEARRQGRGAYHDEDLKRTVALGGAPAPAGALDETLPVNADPGRPGGGGPAHFDAARFEGAGFGGAGIEARFDGAQYGRYRWGRAPEANIPALVDEAEPRSGGRLTRRVLFAAAGLSLVGGGGYAAARAVSTRDSRPAAASGPASGSPPGAPQPTHAAGAPVDAPSSSASGPGDLSSSSAAAPPPPPPSASAGPSRGASSSAPGLGAAQTQPEYYIHAGAKMIALTLDDGPSNVYTPQVLELLAQYKITATFCMIGQQIAANASLVREVAAAGHAIVNHTWNHADQSKLSLSAVRSQIQRANDALAHVGVHPSIFRAPYGAWSPTVFQACAEANLRLLDWSVDPEDWSRPGTSVIVSRIMKNTRTGSIVLEHDGGGDRSQTVAALKIVLPQLLDAGYRFTSV